MNKAFDNIFSIQIWISFGTLRKSENFIFYTLWVKHFVPKHTLFRLAGFVSSTDLKVCLLACSVWLSGPITVWFVTLVWYWDNPIALVMWDILVWHWNNKIEIADIDIRRRAQVGSCLAGYWNTCSCLLLQFPLSKVLKKKFLKSF